MLFARVTADTNFGGFASANGGANSDASARSAYFRGVVLPKLCGSRADLKRFSSSEPRVKEGAIPERSRPLIPPLDRSGNLTFVHNSRQRKRMCEDPSAQLRRSDLFIEWRPLIPSSTGVTS